MEIWKTHRTFWKKPPLGSLRNWRKYDEAWLWKSDCIGRLENGVKLLTLYVEGHLVLATLIYSVAQQPTRPFFLHFFFCWWSKTLHHYHHLCVSSQWCMTHWRDWRMPSLWWVFVNFLSCTFKIRQSSIQYAGSLRQTTHRPSVWCSKYYFFFHNFLQNSLQKSIYFLIFFL